MDEIITTTTELWKIISNTAHFNNKEYDMEMLKDIRNNLGLPQNGDIAVLLKQYNISCENLLNTVLHCLRPFSVMLNDLYILFQKAGAQQTNYNLRIQFDFGSINKSFSEELNFFHQQAISANELVVQATSMIPAQPYKFKDCIEKICDSYNNSKSISELYYEEDIQQWLQEYDSYKFGNWPDYLPNQPSSGYADLDKQISILWQIFAASLWKYRNEYSENKMLGDYNTEDRRFGLAETDRWLGAYVRIICDLTLDFYESDNQELQSKASSYAKKIEEVLKKCEMRKISTELQIKSVIDILNLPFWKKRYELYSVWISTQILDILSESHNVYYHVKDNTLSFSFSGSHIATLNNYNPPLELWTEVRTYYDSPKSPSRKRHIQPDYTLAIGDAYLANNSVAVIECKQYKKYSKKNFLFAVEDYAGGRPNSNVFLVNYGPISSTLKNNISSKYRNRVNFQEKVRPLTSGAANFKRLLKKIIDQYYDENYMVKLPIYPLPESSCTIRLIWSDKSQDLYLHLIISTKKDKCHIYYNNTGNKNNYPYASIGSDYQHGKGNEVILINNWISGEYDIYVNDYKNEQTISGAITVSIECNKQILYAISHTEPIKENTCWHPFHIENEKIIPINEIVDTSVL